ncbi:MAG: 5-formyltetrahydrofolate cyclo-ligase [Rhodocyclaceae bacterium]|nr:5-formyltetrahydrofolate cyclo-ligase [Rhodocyclaceae bacterium]
METARKQLRRDAIAAREALDDSARALRDAPLRAALAALIDELAPTVLGFCWPYRGEPDLRALVTRWLAAGTARRAALPVVDAATRTMRFRQWTRNSEMIPDRHGIPMPARGATLTPTHLLIPLNAFDALGYRLGYGAGYFDRCLAALDPAPVAIGVGYELGRVATTHPQAHDRPMDWLVTEAGIHPIAR